jgi:tetratricopeptide (TPR) repeat protein
MNKQEALESLEKAVSAGKNRDYRSCISILRGIYAEAEELPEVALYLGRAHHALNEYRSAIAYLKEYHRKKPASVAGMFFLGRAYYCAGYPKEALFQLKRALNGSPDSKQIETYLAFAYFKARRHDIALHHFSRLVEKDPENSRIYQAYLNSLYIQAIRTFHRGDISDAEQMFRFLHEKGVESVLLFLYMGMIAREEGRLHDALWAYEKALAMSPDDELIRYQYAVILNQLGRRKEALGELSSLKSISGEEADLDPGQSDYQLALRHYEERNFRKASYYALRMIKAGVDDTDIRLLIGECFRQLGEFTKAENHYTRALEMDRSRVEGRYGIAMTMWQTSRFEEMLHVLAQIERSDPGNDIALYYTALCLWKLNRSGPEALKMARKALEKNAEDPFLFNVIGELYAGTGDLTKAETWYEKAFKTDPSAQVPLENLVELHEAAAGENDDKTERKLIKEYEALIALADDNREWMRKRMILLYKREDFVECARAAEQFLKVAPEDIQALRIIGICHRKNDHYAEAARTYQHLLKKDPFNERFLISFLWALEKDGRRKEASAVAEKAAGAMKKPSYTMLLILGLLHYRGKIYDKAEEVFRQAVQVSPESWQAYHNLGMTLKKKGQDGIAERYLNMASQRMK